MTLLISVIWSVAEVINRGVITRLVSGTYTTHIAISRSIVLRLWDFWL